jgi:hypothetical protein
VDASTPRIPTDHLHVAQIRNATTATRFAVTSHATAKNDEYRDPGPTTVEADMAVIEAIEVAEEDQDLTPTIEVAADLLIEDTVATTVEKVVTAITEDVVVAALDHQAMIDIKEEMVVIVTDTMNVGTEADLQDREQVATRDSAEAGLPNRREILAWIEVKDKDQAASRWREVRDRDQVVKAWTEVRDKDQTVR